MKTLKDPFWNKVALDISTSNHPSYWNESAIMVFLDRMEEKLIHICKYDAAKAKLCKVPFIKERFVFEHFSTISSTSFRRIFIYEKSFGQLTTKHQFAIYLGYNSYQDYVNKNNIDLTNKFTVRETSRNQVPPETRPQFNTINLKDKSIKSDLFSDVRNTNLLNDPEKELFNKAIAHFNLEEYDEALSILELLSNELSSPRILLNYGYLLYRKARYEKAISVYRKIIEINPYFVEAYLNAFKVCITLNKMKEARKYSDAAHRLAPYRKDVIQARAMYFYSIGETDQYLKVMGEVDPQKNLSPPSEEDLEKIRDNSSILIGSKKISALLVVFANAGLRTVFVGYKDGKNDFKKPNVSFKWNPLIRLQENEIKVEKLDIEDTSSLIGYRVNGLEKTEDGKEKILGFLVAEFEFEHIEDHDEEEYVGLFFVNVNKNMTLEPQKVFVRELLNLPEGDLVDLYQDMLFPKSEYNMNKNINAPRVFLSYAKEDYSIVDKIFKELRKSGIDAWQDNKSLKIGDDYEQKISKAIENSDFAIVFLSNKSITKTGFVSLEFKKILESAKYRPLGFPFALPIKLDNCEVPREFSKHHWLELFGNFDQFTQALIQQIKEQFKLINKAR